MTLDDVLEPPTVGALAQGTRAVMAWMDRDAWWRVPTQGRQPDHMEVRVTIRDVRSHFGTLDFLVEPVLGNDVRRWVRADSLTLIRDS